jgi:TorA maturation chaperone TorD
MDRSLARSNIYRMLSMLFHYPDKRFHSFLKDGQWQKELGESLNTLDEKYFAGCFEDLTNNCSAEKMASPQEIAMEYERLFSDPPSTIDNGSGYMQDVLSVLPEKMRSSLKSSGDLWKKGEAAENSVSGRTKVKTRFHVQKAKPNMQKAGFNVQKFEVMADLAELESKVVCGERIRLEEVQLDFLSKFIVPSVSIFCEEVIANSTLDFYRTIGFLAREFVKFEENYLGVPEETDTS